MPATAEQKRQFQNELKTFKSDIDNLTKEISLMNKVGMDNPNLKYYIKVGQAIEHLKITGNYLAISDVSNEILNIKNDSYLNNGRKEIYKVLQKIEEIVSNEIDLTLNENQDMLARIEEMNARQKLNLLQSIKKIIKGMIERFGPNTKWRWSFQELHSRLAVLSKNLTNWREVEQNRDPRAEFYQDINLLARFVKDELFYAAQEYKRKYELMETKTDEDLKRILDLFEALHKIHNHFGEQEDALKIKNLIEATKEIIEKNSEDEKKSKVAGKAKKKKK